MIAPFDTAHLVASGSDRFHEVKHCGVLLGRWLRCELGLQFHILPGHLLVFCKRMVENGVPPLGIPFDTSKRVPAVVFL